MPNSFTKIVDLVKKTGDNCVVLDNNGDPAYVVISFSNYQKMILGKSEIAGLTEDELLEKINRDIATWKATQEAENQDNFSALDSFAESIQKLSSEEKSLNEADNEPEMEENDKSYEKYYFEPID